MEDILHPLLEHLSFGDAMRLARCSQALWQSIRGQLRLNTAEVEAMRLKRVCRECGVSIGRPTKTRQKNTVYVCDACASSVMSYSELIRRDAIVSRCMWSVQIKRRLIGLTLARTVRGHMYWAYEWRRPFRGWDRCSFKYD